ncbi:MAG: Ig-like domain-containing protein, partial [Clostridiales bacterium]|nr:Ig-like domain-containing protein [Clostridiales bacterium]
MRKKKGIFSLITALIAALVATVLSACSDKAPTQPSPVFTLDKTHIELTVDGNLEQLTLTIANIDEAPVWKSSNTSIATVTVGSSENKATVRPVGKGQAVISAVAGEYIAVCTVKVNPAVNLELLTPSLELLSGTTAMIDVETDAETLTYSSNNTAVATVNSSGLVTGISGGTARITVSGGGKSVVCTVTVTDPYVRLDKDELILTLQEDDNTYQLTAESNGEIEWLSENPDVATVEDGLITAVSEGETNIIASYASAEAVCAVIVVLEKLEVILSETEHELKNGETFKLTATIAPEQTGDDAKVTWSVLKGGDLVSVDDDGNVTANNENNYGEAVVVATSVKDPRFSQKCTITVPNPRADWKMIFDKASLEDALKAGNENKTMYLMNDIDLGGATINSTLGAYNGTFYGNGFEIRNFVCGSLFGSIGNDGVIERLSIVATATNLGSHNGIFGLEMRGKVHDCILDITFGTTEFSAVFGRNATGEITNTVLLLRNPSNTNNVFAGFVQGGGTLKNVYYAVYEGNVVAGGPVQKTDEQLRAASLYSEFDEEIWIIEDGEIPELLNDNKAERIRVSLDAKQITAYVGDTVTLVATVKPDKLEEADKAVKWTSSDTSVATVNNGVVKILKVGKTTITATSIADPEKSASCEITVESATEITLSSSASLSLEIGESSEIKATVNRGALTYASDNTDVATVSSNGTIQAKAMGTALITVQSTANADKYVTIAVTVMPEVEMSLIGDSSVELEIGERQTVEYETNR